MIAPMPRPPRLPPDSLFEPVLDDHGGLDSETMRAAEKLAKWAEKEPKPKGRTITDSQMRRARLEVERMTGTGDWSSAGPRHFVALFVFLHEHVYKVPPSELGPKERLYAAGAASRMLEKEFDGNTAQMATFMRWVWQRETDREKWRRENNRSGSRIGTKLQFNGHLLTDYRLDLARRRKG